MTLASGNITDSDASRYHAVLRAEEGSLALRAAIRMGLLSRAKITKPFSPQWIESSFGLTEQGSAVMLAFLHAIGAYTYDAQSGFYDLTQSAAENLALDGATSTGSYFLLGCPPEVGLLQQMLRGESEKAQPLYSRSSSNPSIMEANVETAETIGSALASRAKQFAPILAEHIARVVGIKASKRELALSDFGAGSPYVANECLARIPKLKSAFLLDQPQALRAAQKMGSYSPDQPMDCTRVVTFAPTNIFTDRIPPTNLAIFSNVLHDWTPEDHQILISRARDSMQSGDIICIHEPLLVSPLQVEKNREMAEWMACYSLALYRLTGGLGRCYTRAEHVLLLTSSGFDVMESIFCTRDGCEAIFGIKR